MTSERLSVRSKPLTSNEIARIAGVSQATVSRVLHSHPGVHSETRKRVQAILKELDYQPNAFARGMKTARSGAVGVVVARLSNPLYPSILQELGLALNKLGLRMMVWDAELGGEKLGIDALKQGVVDGIIFTAATTHSALVREAAELGAPVVLINRTLEGAPCEQIYSDNLAGGRQIARYLVDGKKKRIGLISGPDDASTIRDRERGFREALKQKGVVLSPSHQQRVSKFSHTDGRDAMCRLLELSRPPDAVFCVNDVLALGAIDGARSVGIEVPSDLWVVGYDDIEMAGWDAYELTTVRQPIVDMALLATRLLAERLDHPSRKPSMHCLTNDLVVRRSTGYQRLGRS